jgi:hypothetical protein
LAFGTKALNVLMDTKPLVKAIQEQKKVADVVGATRKCPDKVKQLSHTSKEIFRKAGEEIKTLEGVVETFKRSKTTKELLTNFTRINNLNIKNGVRLPTNKVLDLAEKYLGKGYKEVVSGTGRYVSKDGTRVVRMGLNDIMGKHDKGPHVNFEILTKNPLKPGKMKVVQNMHVYLKD